MGERLLTDHTPLRKSAFCALCEFADHLILRAQRMAGSACRAAVDGDTDERQDWADLACRLIGPASTCGLNSRDIFSRLKACLAKGKCPVRYAETLPLQRRISESGN